jgi:hypothetical protein
MLETQLVKAMAAGHAFERFLEGNISHAPYVVVFGFPVIIDALLTIALERTGSTQSR